MRSRIGNGNHQDNSGQGAREASGGNLDGQFLRTLRESGRAAAPGLPTA